MAKKDKPAKKAATGGSGSTDMTDRSFLGRDFLTWLWFRCEIEGGEFQLGKGDSTAVMVEDALAMVSPEEDGAVMTLRRGTPTVRPEAANALAAGMTLKKARLFVARGPREWQFTLDGETLDVGGLKTPEEEVESEEGETTEAEGEMKEERKAKKKDDEALDELAEKLAAAEEAREVIDALYRQFLEVRLDKDWDRVELPRMTDWVEKKVRRAAATVGIAVE